MFPRGTISGVGQGRGESRAAREMFHVEQFPEGLALEMLVSPGIRPIIPGGGGFACNCSTWNNFRAST